MTDTQRTDVHRPSAIIPTDYEWVAVEMVRIDGTDLGAAEFLIRQREIIRAHMEKTGGTYAHHQHGGSCMICGAWAVYTHLFYHSKSNSYIRTGSDCAEKLALAADSAVMDAFRREARTALAAKAGKRKALALLQANGIEAAWDVQYTPTDDPRNRQDEEQTIRDIVERLIKYGSISEKQVTYVRKLLDRIATRMDRLFTQAAEENHVRDTAAPWVAGRQDISGEIVSAKFVDYDYAYLNHLAATMLKALVKLADGRKLWVSVPRAMQDAAVTPGMDWNDIPARLRGAQITGMRVTVKLSKDDKIFAFGSRPTGGTITFKPVEVGA